MAKINKNETLCSILNALPLYNTNSDPYSNSRQLAAVTGSIKIPSHPRLNYAGQIQIIHRSPNQYHLYPLGEPKPLTVHLACDPMSEEKPLMADPAFKPMSAWPQPTITAAQLRYGQRTPQPSKSLYSTEEHILILEGPFRHTELHVECACIEYQTKQHGTSTQTILSPPSAIYLIGIATICNPYLFDEPSPTWPKPQTRNIRKL